jgi:hypothetical protein
MTSGGYLTGMVKCRGMKENSYDELDDLFAKIRLRLAAVRQSDPETAEELRGLVRQLELWVESLVVDSLKLKSLERKPAKAAEPGKRPQKRRSTK